MSAISQIKQHIEGFEPGALFAAKNFYHLASPANVRQVLGRLLKSGEISSASRGIFRKPKQVAGALELMPSTREITEMITQSTGENIAVHGAEAARQLQLTTQVPMRPIYYTNGRSRVLKIGSRNLELRHMSSKKLKFSNSTIGLVISALSYLGHETVTLEMLQAVRNKIGEEEFLKLMEKVGEMPAWMANIIYRYRKEQGYE